jgi:hypothetical protein
VYVVLVGDPIDGFTVWGPLVSEKPAAEAGELMQAEGGVVADWWIFSVEKPEEDFDPTGAAVVYRGCICLPFEFVGPFKDIDAARRWCRDDGIGADCAIELKPIPQKGLAA